MVHAYYYGTHKIRNSNKIYVFPVVVSYTVGIGSKRQLCCFSKFLPAIYGLVYNVRYTLMHVQYVPGRFFLPYLMT